MMNTTSFNMNAGLFMLRKQPNEKKKKSDSPIKKQKNKKRRKTQMKRKKREIRMRAISIASV